MAFPERVQSLDDARRRFDDQADRVASFLNRADPLADACVAAFAELPPGRGFALLDRALKHGIASVPEAPRALRELFASIDRVPAWVDWDAIRRGGEVLLRSGPFGGIVLGFRSLVLAYAAPGGNKPLVMSGRLTAQASRRLAETARFVHVVSLHDSLRRGGEGFAITIKVRIMHAQVRRLALESGKWRSDAWGLPINQHDMLGTILVFSLAVIDGLRALGFRIRDDEVEDYVALWRYAGHLMGLDPELQFASERDGRRLGDVVDAMQGPPDDDARALVSALFSERPHDPNSRAKTLLLQGYRRVLIGLSRGLVGDALADAVALPDDVFRYALPVVRPLVGAFERIRERSTRLTRAAVAVGDARWRHVVTLGLGERAADFRPPEALAAVHAA